MDIITQWAIDKIRTGGIAPMLAQAGGTELAEAPSAPASPLI